MRIRQVKPAFWSDAKLRDLSDTDRLVYIGLWMEADDSGWLRWDVEQVAVDLFPYRQFSVAESIISQSALVLSSAGRLRILKCGHAQIPNLARHQRLAGTTHQVHVVFAEHQSCSTRGRPRVPNQARNRGDPRVPDNARPVRLGQVRSGQVKRAGARDEKGANGVPTIEEHDSAMRSQLTPTEQADTWWTLWRNPNSTANNRAKAEKELEKLGYAIEGKELVRVKE